MPDTSLPREDPELLLLRIATHVLARVRCVEVPVEVEQPYKGKLLFIGFYPDGRRPDRGAGRWLSDKEARVVALLRDGGNRALSKAEVCRQLGWPYDPTHKGLLNNLIDRQVLEEPDEGGVRLAG